ncbi:hypothetical protein E2C01_072835 [Portunus trituberculatus]|uniref:Uncharacterized protein n=1 Tax=Portunus trituberculatus TaxID=210409 RepID=A0A5B7HZ43_PORTR|nr:hypothetical protein [Portunus trituberculatus]
MTVEMHHVTERIKSSLRRDKTADMASTSSSACLTSRSSKSPASCSPARSPSTYTPPRKYSEAHSFPLHRDLHWPMNEAGQLFLLVYELEESGGSLVDLNRQSTHIISLPVS